MKSPFLNKEPGLLLGKQEENIKSVPIEGFEPGEFTDTRTQPTPQTVENAESGDFKLVITLQGVKLDLIP